jgi:hypothetical protein
MTLSLAVLHVRHQRDKYKDLLCPLPSRMWWCYTGPPSPRASKKHDRVMGPPPLPPRWAGGGGGTGKSAHVEWRRD